MSIKLSSLSEMENVPASLQDGVSASTSPDGRVAVVVELQIGAALPKYLELRMQISQQIVTAWVDAKNLDVLNTDPDVKSFSLGQRVHAVSETEGLPQASEWLDASSLEQVRADVKSAVGSVTLTTETDIFKTFKL